MGFLATLARQIKNKDDDEALEIISRRTGINPPLPAPSRGIVSVGNDPTPPAPATILPMPNRMNMAGLGPPPGTPEYAIGEMEDVARQQAQMQPDLTNASIGPTGSIVGARYPVRVPAIPAPSRTAAAVEAQPEPIVSGPYVPPPMGRVRVGETYEGMNPTQQAQARLRALRGAAPESKVRDTGTGYEILPPQKTGRLKAAGKGFLQLLGAGAPFGIGGMGGSGLVGAIQGAINPGTVDARGRAMEIAGAENQLARAQGLDAQGIQNETRRIQNLSQVAGLQNDALDRELDQDKELRVEWQQGLNNIGELQKRQEQLDPSSAPYAAAEDAIKQEATRLAKRTGRSVTVIPGNRRINKLPHLQIDGQVIQQQHDGSWKAIYGSPKQGTEDTNADLKSEYEWQTKNTENEAKRTAAMQEATSYEATATDHQQKVQAAAKEVSRLDGLLTKLQPTIPGIGPNPEYATLKAQRDQFERVQNTEQAKMDAAYKQANEKKAEAQKYPTLPAPPKRARRGNSTTGQKLSKSAWEAANPGKDWNLAVQAAQQRGIPIVP